MPRQLNLQQPTAKMYAKLAEAQVEKEKAFKERLISDCNTLLNELQEKLSIKNVINANNKSNRELEDIRQTLLNLKTYLS